MEDTRYAQDALNRADAWINNGDGSRVNVTEGAFNPDGKLVAGAANTDSGYMYLDLGEGSRGSIVNTLIHEGMHLDGAGDRMADLTGWLGDATYRLNAWANSGQIAQHHAVVPVQNLYLHQQLINQNNAGFANDAANGALLYRQLNRSEIAAVHGPENQALYQDVRARFGLEPSDDPGRDLYLAAMNRVDAGSAELLSPDFVSELVIDHLATQSSGAGEAYHNSSGSRGGLFEVTASDYVDPQVNSTALWNEESFNDFPIKNALLSGLGEMGQHDLFSGVYLPAMEHASAESADALSQQTAMIFGGALAAPALISGTAATYGFATTQGQFWGGAASHFGMRGAQSVGATVQSNLWAAGNAAGQGMTRANMMTIEMLYGTGRAATGYTAFTGGVGFFSGISGGVPGTPPSYIPDGLPATPFIAPWQTGESIGAGVRDGLLMFRGFYRD